MAHRLRFYAPFALETSFYAAREGRPYRASLRSQMSAHKYKIGQSVDYSPGRMTNAVSRDYRIVRLLPPENGRNQYRIKSGAEPFERMASEEHLSKK
jgi:hypothetical protein